MAERLFGMETEYGLAVRGGDKKRLSRAFNWADRFIDVASQCLPHLPSADGGGLFLPNGARFYMDCGHPEMTTPECANPWDVVRYMHAGERTLTTVAEELKARDPGVGDVLVFKTNVDHGGGGTTWGCHTSFLHRADPALLPQQIIPHLVSRIIYTGCGGLNLNSAGLEFTLSPRVAFLQKEISGNCTRERGIFHTKGRVAQRGRLSPAPYYLRRKSLFSNRALAQRGGHRVDRGPDRGRPEARRHRGIAGRPWQHALLCE